jgi:hypothetical protein
VSASLRKVAEKIWLALPTSAVPLMTPPLSVMVPETPMPTGLGPPNSGLASGLEVWRFVMPKRDAQRQRVRLTANRGDRST